MSTPDPSTTSDLPGVAATPLAVTCVRALLERHGLPKYRQSAWLADATGLSYSQAHRRLSGASPWTLEDLDKVAAMFGETLAEAVSAVQTGNWVAADLAVGSVRLPCRLRIGNAVNRHTAGSSVVAVKTEEGWSVVVAREATDDVVYKIERLEATPVALARRSVAVLDDDHDLTNSICAHLASTGYDARPFYRISELIAGAAERAFDAYIVDWIIGDTSVLKLISTLRERDPKCPIVVLTAQVLAGVVQEADIAAAVKRYDLTFSEKPVRTSILEATLARALANATE